MPQQGNRLELLVPHFFSAWIVFANEPARAMLDEGALLRERRGTRAQGMREP
jgi:hypothetical protein